MLHISTTIMRYGMLGILLERSDYALSNDVLKRFPFLTYVTALSTGTGFYITSLILIMGGVEVILQESIH